MPVTAAKAPLGSSSRSWQALTPPLAEWILDAVSSMGFKRMTPVQASTIPLFMGHKDVVVEAVTGSGKTLSYLIPVIERLLRLEEPCKKHHVAAIVVSPTRELATQIHTVLQSLIAFHSPSAIAMKPPDEPVDLKNYLPVKAAPQISSGLRIVSQLLVGGNTTPAQDLSLFLKTSPNVLVSTPGRLLELLSSPHVHCPQSSFEVLVLDEADRLLDLGFKDDLQKILGRLPKQRRTGLFSASVSEAVGQIVRVGLRNPVKIAVKVKGTSGQGDQRTPASLQMSYVVLPASHKIPALFKLLRSLDPIPSKSIVYLSTCAAVDYFQNLLPLLLKHSGETFSLVPLHGKHPPNVRQKNFARFSNSTSPSILLTTDVAARGLDIPQVDLVVQIDPPSDPKVFLHRCGRAGRAGRSGLAVIFLQTGREEDYVPFLDIRKTPVSLLSQPDITVSPEEAAFNVLQMREIVFTDRALHDKAQRGFVSWLQAYSKHQASSIFRVADLEWADLGEAWALLRMPKMPELKNWEGDKTLGLPLDLSSYAYKDKQREEQRRLIQDTPRTPLTDAPKTKSTNKRAWSEKLDQRDERERRRVKRQTKRKREKWELMSAEEREKQVELEKLISEARQKVNDDVFEGFDT